jgi:hypothetical protein
MGAALCCLSFLGPKELSDQKHVGLRKKRGCTDVLCLLLYIIALFGFTGLCALAYTQGM